MKKRDEEKSPLAQSNREEMKREKKKCEEEKRKITAQFRRLLNIYTTELPQGLATIKAVQLRGPDNPQCLIVRKNLISFKDMPSLVAAPNRTPLQDRTPARPNLTLPRSAMKPLDDSATTRQKNSVKPDITYGHDSTNDEIVDDMLIINEHGFLKVKGNAVFLILGESGAGKSFLQWGKAENEIFGVPQIFAERILHKLKSGKLQNTTLSKSDFTFHPCNYTGDKTKFPCYQTFPRRETPTDPEIVRLLQASNDEGIESNFIYNRIKSLQVKFLKMT